MTSIILLPANISFKTWITDLNRSVPGLIVPIPDSEKNWQKWAMLLIANNVKTLSTVVLPLKHSFPKEEDWRRWAYFFIQSMFNK